MTIRVWLVGFVLLFVGVELLEWLIDSQPGGYWAMLGGLGLAAVSNYKHLPNLNGHRAEAEIDQTNQVEAKPSTLEQPAQTVDKAAGKGVDRSEDSVSFRVRFPWQ